MSKIGARIEFNEFKTKILPWASRLAKDFNWEVRKAIALNLDTYFEILKNDKALCDEYLYDELLDLIDDEESEVRDLAIKQFNKMCYFTAEKFREKGIDHLKTIIERNDDHS